MQSVAPLASPDLTTSTASSGSPFAQHVIEPELLQGYPRVVQPTQPSWPWNVTVSWLAIGAFFLANPFTLGNHPENYWLFAIMFIVLGLIQAGTLLAILWNTKRRTAARREYRLLRYGIPVPAVIYDV